MLPWKVKDVPRWFTSLPGIDSHPGTEREQAVGPRAWLQIHSTLP